MKRTSSSGTPKPRRLVARASCASPPLTPAQRLRAFGELPQAMRTAGWSALRNEIEQRENVERAEVVR